jgi:peptide deformylase
MAIRKVARLGHPILRQRGRELTREEIQSPEMSRLIEDMVETMEEYGGIGLAAPQIHESISLAIVAFAEDNFRYPEMGESPLRVFFNPKIEVLDHSEQGFWEGCLSVPGLKGYVERPKKIKVTYLDVAAIERTIEAEGFLATVFQHEFDHLDGFLYVDRLRSMNGQLPFLFSEEFVKHQKAKEESEPEV